MTEIRSNKLLNGTHLKLIALVSMTLDHVAILLMGNYLPFRIIGRIAFPIFAFMISEGCRYTKNKLRYFSVIFCLGIICQTVYFIFDRSLYMNILISLSLSILIIYCLQYAKKRKTAYAYLPLLIIISALYFSDLILKTILLKNTNYALDYTFMGIMLPVLISVFDNHKLKLCMTAVGLTLVSLSMGSNFQLFSLLALISLYFYNGKGGKHRFKWLFYLYYPLHLALLYIIKIIY